MSFEGKKMVIANFGQESNTKGKRNSLPEAEVLKPQAAATRRWSKARAMFD